MKTELQEQLAQGINQRSADPRADENGLDADWQAGYLVGNCTVERHELWDDNHPITVEWRARGMPKRSTPEFYSWKCGYWAGIFRQIVT